MKKITSLLFYLLCINLSFAQVNFTDSNLPIVVINTNGQEIPDDPKITCDMGIIWNGDGERNYLSDSFNDYNGKIGIEIRGSTSQQYPKKGYGLETRDELGNNLNVSLLGMPTENDWILYGAYPDKSLMRNEITYALFFDIQDWSPRYVYCELVINDEYLGVYTLMEKIKRDDDRIDIARLDEDDIAGDSLTGGYIIKIDKTTGASSETWISDYQDKLKFLYHDPQYDEMQIQQLNYIENYVRDFEDAVYSPEFEDSLVGYRAYINVGSFIDFMLMQELGRTVDGYRSSSFMYKDKDSKGGKLTCGPMWDFNLSYGNADYCEAFDTIGWQYEFAEACPWFNTEPPEWWPRLLEDTTFSNELQCRWLYLRSTILSTEYINNWIDSTAQYLDESQERNFTKWPILGEYVNWNYFVGETYEEEIDYLKWWFQSRSAILDEHLPGNCNIVLVDVEEKAVDQAVSVFPNPTRGLLYTTASADATIRLFGVGGNEIKVALSNGQIDLHHLSPGFYVLSINGQAYKVLKL